jgi:hypothetical protein
MRSRSPRQFAVVLALCLAPRALPAQFLAGELDLRSNAPNAQNVPTATVHINGVVVSSVDGKPVARVLVTSMDRRFAALTDWQGRFSFDFRVPDNTSRMQSGSFGMPMQLMLRKPGYTAPMPFPVIQAPAPNTPAPTIQLKITPSGVIVGRVTPESGDVPSNLRVNVRRRQAQDGFGMWAQVSSAAVAPDGEFRIPSLQPGDYVLETSASSPIGNFGMRQRQQQRPDTVRGLLPTFYPQASTLAEATRIHVGPGETVTANLRPTSATLYRVSLAVGGIAAGDNFGASLLPDNSGFNLTPNAATHTLEGYLPTGSYTARILDLGPRPQPASNSGSTAMIGFAGQPPVASYAHFQVATAPLVQTITPVPAADIQVNVTRDFTNQQNTQQSAIMISAGPPGARTPPVYMDLQPVDQAGSSIGISSGELNGQSDTMTLRNIPEGVYHVRINAPQGYVASASSGGTNLLTTPLTVGSGASNPPINITLRDDTATLAVRPQTGQPETSGAINQQSLFSICIPLDAPETRSVQMSWFGQRSLQGIPVPPGRYLALVGSLNLLQTVEYRDPDVLKDLMSKGVVVTVSGGQKLQIDVPVLPDGGN